MYDITEAKPELHFIAPTPHVPNSRFPVVLYRNVLHDTSPDHILATIHPNGWIKGGTWKAYDIAHFHSTTHECYAVMKGKSTLSLGKSPIDSDTNDDGKDNGIHLCVAQGDVFVLPAGVSHCSLDSEGDYEYIGLYPEASPKWDMNLCKDTPETTAEKAVQCRKVPIPDKDPVYGSKGPLPEVWRNADRQISGA